MAQSALLQFESTSFPIADGEDDETNPGLFGKSLAEWVAKRLRSRGIAAADVIAEDFGWCVSVPLPPYTGYVACCSVNDVGDQWQVFAFVEGGLLRRLIGRDERAVHLASLYSELKACLEESAEIHGLREEPHAA